MDNYEEVKKVDYESKNKKIRLFSYLMLATSLVIIGAVGTVFYKTYKDNLALRETMEQIIEAHEEHTIVSGDSTYSEDIDQDTTIDGEGGKVVIEFPGSH